MEHMAVGLQELKLAGDAAEGMTFSGYGAVFNNIDSYGDMIVPGAFADTLHQAKNSGRWPAMLAQHGGWGVTAEDMMPIGIWTDLAEDGVGLKVTGKLADTPRGREAYALLKMDPRPAIDGLSIGYIAKAYEPRSKPEDPRRKLTKLDLLEVSLVTFPANPKARTMSVKSMSDTEFRELKHEIEAALTTRGAGLLSRSEARALLGSGFEALTAMRGAGAAGDLAELIRRNVATLKG